MRDGAWWRRRVVHGSPLAHGDAGIPVGLHAEAQRPVHRIGIPRVYIAIDRDDYLSDGDVEGGSSVQRLPRLPRVGFVQLYHQVVPGAAGLVKGDILDGGDVAVVAQELVVDRLVADLRILLDSLGGNWLMKAL